LRHPDQLLRHHDEITFEQAAEAFFDPFLKVVDTIWSPPRPCRRPPRTADTPDAAALTVMERQLRTLVRRHTGRNQPQAAQILGITRNSWRHKLRALGITIARAVCAADDQSDP
jgi:DNA-binding NtrC family response regulator